MYCLLTRFVLTTDRLRVRRTTHCATPPLVSFSSIHPCTHQSIHSSIYRCILFSYSCIDPFIFISTQCYIYSFIRLPTHPSVHLYIHPVVHLFIHSFAHPSIRPSIHSFIHPSIHPFIFPFKSTDVHSEII